MKLKLINEDDDSVVAIELDVESVLESIELAGHTFQNMIKIVKKEKQNGKTKNTSPVSE